MGSHKTAYEGKHAIISLLDVMSVLAFMMILAIGSLFHFDFHSTTFLGVVVMLSAFGLSSYLSFLWELPRFSEFRQLVKES
jgi:hypothetical protein